MPSASSPVLSRVASPNRTHVLLLKVRVGVVGGGGGELWVHKAHSRVNWVQFLMRRILDGSGW